MAKHTLLIDDDPYLILIMQKFLEIVDFDHHPFIFESGHAAMAHLKAIYNREDTFTIFLDLNMPIMNGWDFLDELAHFARPSNTYVLIITSSISPQEKVRATQNPFVIDFDSKPISADMISSFKALIDAKLNAGQ
jgi:CheY-like chemotaxis protein